MTGLTLWILQTKICKADVEEKSIMFFSSIKCDEDRNTYPAPIQYAVDYLKRTDFSVMQPGDYELEQSGYQLQVIDMETEDISLQELEVHRTHVDVQFLASGEGELIGYAPNYVTNQIARDELDAYDILYYTEVENETFLTMRPGNFAVFFPWDVHRPGCILEKSCQIRKIVIKVEMSLFD